LLTVAEPLAYLNGRMIPAAEASLPVYDAGVAFGAAVTEITRTFHHRPFRLADHLDRLFRSLRYAHLEIDLSPEKLTAITLDLVAHNAQFLGEGEDLGINHFVTAGEVRTYARLAGRSLRTTPTVAILTFPLRFELYADKMRTGAHLVTPSIRQIPPECLDPHLKCRSRMHYYLADREAQQVDPATSALLLDLAGRVTETSTANFLMVEHGTIVSPPAAHTLAGISRQTAIELAAQLGIPFAEREIWLPDALNADEAFLTSTPYCLMPVSRINGHAIGDGTPGPIYRRLLEAWNALVGLDIMRQVCDFAV
jgi:branched-subunit amino acid aminotransferase/4-amino-4-deoxychorismate lyase